MSKVWVDPADGWQYGFPMIYDDQVDGNMHQWMLDNGLPEELALLPIRAWNVDEEIVLRD